MRDWLLLFGLCATGLVIGSLQARTDRSGTMPVSSQAAHAIASPVSAPVRGIARWADDFAEGMASATQLARKDRRLRSTESELAQVRAENERLAGELNNLRALIELPATPERRRIAADVVGLHPFEHRLTLNVGSAGGVRPGLPVVSAYGLVGIIQTCGANRSQVALLSSPAIKLGAIVQRDPPSAGLIRGESPSILRLDLADPSAPVEVGDLVTTSGFSERIPKGLPIGRVVQVEDDPEFGSRRAKVFPFINPAAIREVMVLR